MSDGISDAAKQTAEAVRKFQLQYLKDIPTCLIFDELKKREGVSLVDVPAYAEYSISIESDCAMHSTGPARILVVID